MFTYGGTLRVVANAMAYGLALYFVGEGRWLAALVAGMGAYAAMAIVIAVQLARERRTTIR